mmetsp:Transcript_25509/g.82127  ORF Transcript_25509/g.82127 Transcript_25509/m.82127 type:complete len:297 (+) Transcript_25509:1202-2092(+)
MLMNLLPQLRSSRTSIGPPPSAAASTSAASAAPPATASRPPRSLTPRRSRIASMSGTNASAGHTVTQRPWAEASPARRSQLRAPSSSMILKTGQPLSMSSDHRTARSRKPNTGTCCHVALSPHSRASSPSLARGASQPPPRGTSKSHLQSPWSSCTLLKKISIASCNTKHPSKHAGRLPRARCCDQSRRKSPSQPAARRPSAHSPCCASNISRCKRPWSTSRKPLTPPLRESTKKPLRSSRMPCQSKVSNSSSSGSVQVNLCQTSRKQPWPGERSSLQASSAEVANKLPSAPSALS